MRNTKGGGGEYRLRSWIVAASGQLGRTTVISSALQIADSRLARTRGGRWLVALQKGLAIARLALLGYSWDLCHPSHPVNLPTFASPHRPHPGLLHHLWLVLVSEALYPPSHRVSSPPDHYYERL